MGTKRNREEFDNSSLFSYSIESIYPSERGQPQWLAPVYVSTTGTTLNYPITMNFYAACTTAMYGASFTATAWFSSQTSTNIIVYGERWSSADWTAGISSVSVLLLGY